MKTSMLDEMIGDIDDDLIVAADGDKCENKLMKPKSLIKWASLAAACLAVCAVMASPLFKSEGPNGDKEMDGSELDEAGGTNGNINISDECIFTGTEYAVSNEEGYAYLDGIKDAIKAELNACGVDTDDFRITKTGYAHMRTGSDGNSMALDWRDYIAYSKDKIAAIISVTKDENGMRYYSMWGSPGFEEYGRFLSEHKGCELVYIWAGDVEAVIMPDNSIFCLSDINSVVTDDAPRYYDFFKTQYNTYIPE